MTAGRIDPRATLAPFATAWPDRLAQIAGGGAKAAATVEKIVEAAAVLVADVGIHHTTMRQVAATAGIAPGNVTYYFETKAALLEAVIWAMVRDDAIALEQVFQADHRDADLLAAVVERLLIVGDDPRRRLLMNFWVMALYDERLAALKDQMYAAELLALEHAVARHIPGRTPAARRRDAARIQAHIEGIVVVGVPGSTGDAGAIGRLARSIVDDLGATEHPSR